MPNHSAGKVSNEKIKNKSNEMIEVIIIFSVGFPFSIVMF